MNELDTLVFLSQERRSEDTLFTQSKYLKWLCGKVASLRLGSGLIRYVSFLLSALFKGPQTTLHAASHTRVANRDTTFTSLVLLPTYKAYNCNSPRCILASSLIKART
jgi:hypothetical protein